MPVPASPSDPPVDRKKSVRDRGRALREAGPYLGLGTTLAATVLAGVGAGYWLDEKLGTQPWFLLVGGTLGVGASLTYFFRMVSSLSKRRADQKR